MLVFYDFAIALRALPHWLIIVACSANLIVRNRHLKKKKKISPRIQGKMSTTPSSFVYQFSESSLDQSKLPRRVDDISGYRLYRTGLGSRKNNIIIADRYSHLLPGF